ncbi:hypothetical protein BHM03_00028127 [Ensete ventricosum]|uniref:Uncharacterized protein n=1 Tax=Ensete ventricosum TaxID=4639 RepID=A0A445MHR7_ENSVE|nr:hypothetical protein BHM03_00028127 [Ensete ventricosum]
MLEGGPTAEQPNDCLGKEMPTAHHTLRLGGQLPLPPHGDGNTSAPTSSRYWQLFNDMRFSPSGADTGHPVIFAEAFLRLTPQVQALVPMMQTIVSLIPQLVQQMTLLQQSSSVAQLTLFTAPHDLLMRPMTELSAPDFQCWETTAEASHCAIVLRWYRGIKSIRPICPQLPCIIIPHPTNIPKTEYWT